MVAVDITPYKDEGVLKEIIKEGIGDETPAPRSTVMVHYIATLMDGTKFDSSRDRNEPFQFVLQNGDVIKGWDVGIATMKKGEIAVFICAPDYAYSVRGCPPKIPPNATLKFEIEMIDWKEEDLSPNGDGSIERYQIKQGKGHTKRPVETALVNVHLTGIYNDKIFEDREVSFPLGEGEGYGVIEGVEHALKSFNAGEKSRLKIKSKYAFKDAGKPEFDIPPNATVEYIVELISFEKSVKPWFLTHEEKIEQATIYKEKGTKYFKSDKYNLAINMYKKSISFLNECNQETGYNATDVDNLKLAVYLNLALCYLKTDQNVEAKDECNEALKLSPQNVKALFRRGQACLALASPEIALKDFQEVLKIEPTNTAAAKQITVCNQLIKKHLAKEKKLYANMFDKFAQEDKQ